MRGLAMVLLALPTLAQGAAIGVACSPDALKAKLNEVAFSGGSNPDKAEFIEVYFLLPVTTSGWKVCYNSAATCVSIPNASYGAGTFWVASLPSSTLNNNNGEVILLDGAGKGLDHLSWDNKASCSSNVWDMGLLCGGDYCLAGHNASKKDIARLLLDGLGLWGDNGDNKTQGCSNLLCAPAPSSPGGFNAVDTGNDVVSGVIKTKIAGQAFSLDVAALNPAGNAKLPSYTGTVTVTLVDAASSASCAAMTVLQSLGSHTYNGAGGGKDNGLKTLSITYANAAPNVKVRMVDSGAGVTACSSDAFAVRPYSLAGPASAGAAVSASDTDWETAGSARSLDNGGASGGTLHKAGRPFTLRVQAWSATGAATPGYTGTPSLSLVSCLLPASGCSPGTLSAGTVSTSAGLASTSTATYAEVGAVSARLYDSDFAAIDAGDGSSLAERTVESAAFTLGRFVPDRLDLATNAAAFAPACGGFTYQGQPFGFGTAPAWTATARNAAGATTVNYTGALFKIAPATVTGQAWSATTGTLEIVDSLDSPVVTSLGAGVGRIDFGVGGGLRFARAALAAPFDASLTLAANVADQDGVAYASNPYSQAGIGFTGGQASQRFGRLRAVNAYGSELLALPVPLTAQYWNGLGFVRNGDDNCTAIPALAAVAQTAPLTPGLTFYPAAGDNQLAAGETTASLNSPLVAGSAGLVLSAPGLGNHGYLDLVADAPAWLDYNWDGVDQGGDGNLYDDNPRSRAAFGKHRGSDRVIIRREMY
jgi:hypothetical protein